MLKWLNQALGSIKETKVLGAEKFFMDYFSRFCRDFSHARRALVTISEFPRLVFETIAVCGVIVVVLTMLTLDKTISSIIPMLALFTAAAFRIMPALSRVMNSLTTIRHHMPALEAVHHDLNHILKTRRGPDPEPGIARLDFRHSIIFKHVDFSYDSSNIFALQNISFEILKGQTVAFVGPTGSGKTSIVDLIIGLLEPTGGEILIDDHAISDLNQVWRKNIGYIPQSIFLLDDTIRRNVALGVQEEDIDDELAWKALRMANVEDFVQTLPGRLESVIGEHGVRISGGQRQRIGIARALYHDPAVLVLDEATSALDYETENAITESIRELAHHKTIIIIAHRIETLKGCDQIFVVNNGRIQDSGSYAELASRPSYLENIINMNSGTQ
jgi:ATP-binding cassette subfamily C protein